jgi:truncated hemoglobin YjbI
MKRHVIVSCEIGLVMAVLCGCSSMGSTASAVSAFEKLGGTSNVSSLASGFVTSSLKDPRLAGLTAGKTIDQTAATGKVSNQLCAMLGGGCKAPLTDSQLSAAASKVSPDQSKAISEHFGTALSSVASDSAVRELVTNTVGSKLPGVLAGVL